MSIYKLYATGTGGNENSVSSLDVQFEGLIVAIHGTVYAPLDADDEFCSAEVSFLSSNTFAVNDARGSLFILGTQIGMTTSGVAVTPLNSGIGGLEVPVSMGERIHLHLSASASTVTVANVYLYVVDGAKVELRRRR